MPSMWNCFSTVFRMQLDLRSLIMPRTANQMKPSFYWWNIWVDTLWLYMVHHPFLLVQITSNIGAYYLGGPSE